MDEENFLARWLEGSLSEEELQEFKNSEAYPSYAKIIAHVDQSKPPVYNTFKEFNKLQDQLKTEKKSKVVKLDPVTVFFRIAAVFILAIGIYYFLDQRDTHISTELAEHKTFLLPDSSEVNLNAESSVEFNKNSWQKRRALKLDGEAYFKVAKGKTFDVVTIDGIVSVIGTEFKVKNRENYFEVVCYEGVVKVTHRNIEKTLTIGDGFKIFNGVLVEENDLTEGYPAWMDDESTFKSVPLEYVINELERQYEITIEVKDLDKMILFTGGFTHKNLDAALQSICIPLNIKYRITDNKTVLLNVE